MFSIIDVCFEGINLSRSFALNFPPGHQMCLLTTAVVGSPFKIGWTLSVVVCFLVTASSDIGAIGKQKLFCVYFYESTEYRQRFVLNTIVVLLFLSRLQLYCVFVCNSQIQHASPGIVMVNVLENLLAQAVLTVFI